jgi:hypothetical protein
MLFAKMSKNYNISEPANTNIQHQSAEIKAKIWDS